MPTADNEADIVEKSRRFPVIRVLYTHGPIEEIALHFVRTNKVVQDKLVLESLIKETEANPGSNEIQCCTRFKTETDLQNLQIRCQQPHSGLETLPCRSQNYHTKKPTSRSTQCATY